jgi:hypothetical protein
VSYDDDDTFKQKRDFASSRCLGGLMVSVHVERPYTLLMLCRFGRWIRFDLIYSYAVLNRN